MLRCTMLEQHMLAVMHLEAAVLTSRVPTTQHMLEAVPSGSLPA
jgi:hypothetical protein